MFFYDPFFLLLIPAFILAIYAQTRVKSMYSKYSDVPVSSGCTGRKAAREILDSQGLNDVPVKEVQGKLTDHYDPIKRVLSLSSGVFRGSSIASVSIAAHETGHAVQHARVYLPLMIRSKIFPAVSFSSWMAFPLFFIGFLFRTPVMMDIGIVLFIGVVAFQLVTLPVELNASSRAMILLNKNYIIEQKESLHARKVLNAAALTYIAATAVAVLQLLRLILLRQSSR